MGIKDRLEILRYADILKYCLDEKLITVRSTLDVDNVKKLVKKIFRKALEKFLDGGPALKFSVEFKRSNILLTYNSEDNEIAYDNFKHRRKIIEGSLEISNRERISEGIYTNLRAQWRALYDSESGISIDSYGFDTYCYISVSDIYENPYLKIHALIKLLDFHQMIYCLKIPVAAINHSIISSVDHSMMSDMYNMMYSFNGTRGTFANITYSGGITTA